MGMKRVWHRSSADSETARKARLARRRTTQPISSSPSVGSGYRGSPTHTFVVRQGEGGCFRGRPAVAILEAVRPFARFFRTEREIVFVRRGVGPIVVTDRNVAG